MYDPLTTVPTYYITNRNPQIFLNTTLPLQYFSYVSGGYWRKDGVRIADSNEYNLTTTEQNGLRTDTLELTGTDPDSVAGVYIVPFVAKYDYLEEDYCGISLSRFHFIAIGFSIWRVKNYRECY